MKCFKCNESIPDGTSFCPFCGETQKSSPESSQTFELNYDFDIDESKTKTKKSDKNNWYKSPWLIIVLLFVFFPIGAFLLWKYSEFKFKTKVILSIAGFFVFIALISGGSDNSSASETTTQTTESTTITTTLAVDKDIYALTSISNLTETETKAILEDLKSVGIQHIESATIIGEQSNADIGASFKISYDGYSFVLIVIERKTDYISTGNLTLFQNGKPVANFNDYVIDDSEKGSYIYYAKEYVLQTLKAPSTAEFPDTLFKISDWSVSRDKDVVTVKSYVDSQNGFGAMIRSEFAVQMSYSTFACYYIQVNGESVYGSPQ